MGPPRPPPHQHRHADAIATNPPWGRRVRRRTSIDTREFARILRPGGRAVLLVPEATAPPGFTLLDRIPARVSGALVEIAVCER